MISFIEAPSLNNTMLHFGKELPIMPEVSSQPIMQPRKPDKIIYSIIRKSL